jgi:SagB-type dehydrogenase family enzyme
MPRRRPPQIRVKRSAHLVCYWKQGGLIIHNYATGTLAEGTPLVCELLDFCADWRSMAQLRAITGDTTSATLALVDRLVELSFLLRSDRQLDPRETAMKAFASWNPAAGFFHSTTRDVRFIPARQATRALAQQARRWPMPAPVKRISSATTIRLPVPEPGGEFPTVLLARRTWRRFSRKAITKAELATLLWLSCGVQQWVTAAGQRLALKTSPSGGARHPIECYAAVRDVKGLGSGLYHYAADVHALERLGRKSVTAAMLRSYVPRSGHFANGSVMVFFTAVFERQLWRYPYARAYRAALVEAGHVCQTFCLAATWLGLAPFSVMGLADSRIERDLGIDGISEAVLYAAGAGARPRGTAWAPLPRGSLRAVANERCSVLPRGTL